MHGLFDCGIETRFSETLSRAQDRALLDSANSGTALATLHAAEARLDRLYLVVSMPSAALRPSTQPGPTAQIGARQALRIYTAWTALLEASNSLGFMLLAQPLLLLTGAPSCGEYTHAEIALERPSSLPRNFRAGRQHCRSCRLPLTPERLEAIPNAVLCLNCKSLREE